MTRDNELPDPRADFLARIEFEPDQFQVEGFDAIDAGDNVLVAAPTSSGKTLVAEYAIEVAIAAGKRVFYTTPIKALSNQKFSDLVGWLGADQVGLLTGDNVIRGDASVVVMTTEVLRNMIYAGSTGLDDLAFVILDEVHFLQDSYRGPVWEEVIIQTPEQVRLVGLSATVSNALELGEWIGEVRGSCRNIIETTRPVELQPRMLLADRVKRSLEDLALLSGHRPNEETRRFIQKRAHKPRDRSRSRLARPRRVETIDHLYDLDRLPAIFFIFSRKGCDEAVRQTLDVGIDFLDESERRRVETIFRDHTRELSQEDLLALDAPEFLEGLKSGIGAHHAGMVPPFKEAVETCFIAGLLKVVYATETLALGVNMPARSVVIEQLSRFRGEGHVMLTPGDFTQLTGRAGRRGLDEMGYAYVLWSPYVDFEDASRLAGSSEFVLRSVFRPTYNMAANLVATRSEDGAIELLQQSFAQFQANRSIVTLTRRLAHAREDLEAREASYLESHGSLDAPTSARPRPSAPIERSPVGDIDKALSRLKPGDVIQEDQRRARTTLAVLGVSQRRHAQTRLRVVTPRGKTMELSASDFGAVPEAIDRIDLPEPYQPGRREFQKLAAGVLRRRDKERGLDPDDETPESALDDFPPASAAPRPDRLQEFRRIEGIRADIGRIERRLDSAGEGLGRALRSTVGVMEELGHVDSWKLTDRGELLRRIYHEHDLWIAEAIATGALDGLDAARLAGVVSAFSYQRRGPGTGPTPWFPDDITRDRVGQLHAIARRLSSSERRAGLPETPEPDAGFLSTAHAWALGVGLDEVLTEGELTGGDFVRHIRQLVDLLRQIADVAPNTATRSAARAAMHAIDRGLVAAATKVSDGAGLGAQAESVGPDSEPQ